MHKVFQFLIWLSCKDAIIMASWASKPYYIEKIPVGMSVYLLL
jgi:hypothetical protein